MSRSNGVASARQINLKTKELTCFFIMLTPELAKDWLTNHNNINRDKKYNGIEKYLRDQINDMWITNPDPISFDYNGEMISGQHRCEMVVQSGKAIKVILALGFEPAARMVTDVGLTRRPHDVLKLMGFDASPWDTAIVRHMMNGTSRNASMTLICKAYEKYEKKAKIVMGMFPTKKRKLTQSPILAPMARALETYGEELVQEFADIMYDGMASRSRKGNIGVGMLRDYLLELPSLGGNGSREIYCLTESALYAFLNNEKLEKLIPTKEELFPLRGETKLLRMVQPDAVKLTLVKPAEEAVAIAS